MGFVRNLYHAYLGVRHFSKQSNPVIMKYLNVAEKNDAAKNIAALLSRGGSVRREGLSNYNKIYEFDATVFGHPARMVMTSVSGHLLNYEFPANVRSWQSCSPLTLFNAPVFKSCPQDYLNIKKTLEREIRSCQGLIIWTDCDREGENIGFEIIKVCTDVKQNIPVYRAKFSEITAVSVLRALNNLGQPDKNVSDAVDVRQELDLRTGAAFTRLQTLRLQRVFPQKLADKLISYGSCQFPTLGFVVERYQAIEEFVPEPFWKIKMNHKMKDLTVDYNWKRDRLFNKNACEAMLDICQENPLATVEQVESKSKSKWRPLPLDTVELEKTISRKLRINAKATMKIAEKLYTQGYISYPRTETNIFPKELNLLPLVEQQREDNRWGPFAQRIINEGGPNPRQGRKSDQAHPPIHPTKYAGNLTGNEQRIYEYIVRHFLACVHKDAVGHETVVHVDIADEKFIAKGLVILEKNYLDVYTYDRWNGKEIHEYQTGDTFMPSELSLAEGSTTPPKLLTEADLIALMEKHGIGTDATHADHIDTIKSREYVGLHENIYFVPGTLGMGLVEGYNNIGLEVSLAKPSLRADFEKDLKLICEGRKSAEVVRLEQIEKYRAVFTTVMEKMAEIDRTLANRLDDRPQQIPDEVYNEEEFRPALKCPKCGNDMVLRTRKNGAGKFLSCVGYPGCKNAVWFPVSVHTVEVLDENCRICGPNVKMLKVKFKQNPFPGEPNPNTLCIGGCDDSVLDTLNINAAAIRRPNNQDGIPAVGARPNRPNANRTDYLQVIPNQQTLNNWITGANDHRTNQNVPQNQNPNRNNNSGTSNSGTNGSGTGSNSNTRSYSTQASVNNNQTQFGSNNNRFNGGNNSNGTGNSNSNKWLPRSFLNSGNLLPVPSRVNNNNNNGNHGNSFNNNSSSGSSNRPNPSFNGTDRGDVLCNCNNEAAFLTVRKEGPNTGKNFYKCQTDRANGGCNFFQWADDANTPQPRRSTYSANPGPAIAGNLCNCNLPAAERMVSKAGANTGRRFFCCSKPIGEGCNFFKWADENGGSAPNGRGDDDDDGSGGGGGHNQSWSAGNTSRWNGGTGNSWKRKNTKFKGKNKRKAKASGRSTPYNKSNSQGTSKNSRKCGKCGEEGHNRTKCPNK